MSKLIVDGNEVFPGTITIVDNNSTITPKDNLRVILNISGESAVTLSDGTDVTQRVEVFNASNDNCTLSYVSSAGNSTTVLAKNTSIRLLWVGTFWDYSDATTVTGIDDNGQPFAYNIDSLVEPKGVINITGKDADGNSFDYGLGKLVVAADEDNYSTEEVKTSKTWIDGKPIYKKVFDINITTYTDGTKLRNFTYTESGWRTTHNLINVGGFVDVTYSGSWERYAIGSVSPINNDGTVAVTTSIFAHPTNSSLYMRCFILKSDAPLSAHFYAIVEYTKTSD